MVKEREEVLKDPVLRKIVDVIVKELDPDKIILFGSRARGNYDEYSDYDILVLKEGIRPEERRPLQRRIRESLFKAGIYDHASVDILVQSTERYVELKHRWDLVYYSIEGEGVVVYEGSRKAVA